MPKYKVSFEYETEVEADNEEDAIIHCSTVICEYMGDNAIVEEIEQFVKEPTNKKEVSDD